MSLENLGWAVVVLICLGLGLWSILTNLRDSRKICISKVGGERQRGWMTVIDDDAPTPVHSFGPFTVNVHGTECEIRRSPWIEEQTKEFLNKVCTVCASCSKPIFPGMPVGKAWVDAPHPFTHLSFACCDSGALYCGIWGEGRLITLHELHPDKYKPGTSMVISAAFSNPGEVVHQEIP